MCFMEQGMLVLEKNDDHFRSEVYIVVINKII
jgi:hypothetical protein